ncbi:MAG: hypothetical protein V9F04_02565 [Dermatophilaceae bacterium]
MTSSPAPTASSAAVAPAGASAGQAHAPLVRKLSVLLYSDDITVRDAVRVGVGRRPARDVEIERWHECATPTAVVDAADAGGFDLFILDGEATPLGGMGLCRQLKNEIFECPPILVLTGRVQDGWIASWSQADAVVPQPLDPVALAAAVADLGRTRPVAS